MARDRQFRHVVHRGRELVDPARDFTVHARVGGLKPDHEYFYRFATKQTDSRVGRFKTLPPPHSKQPLKIGFFSCQSYEAGYYTAHAEPREGGPRPRPLPRRLHLRAPLLRRTAGPPGHDRGEQGRRRPDPCRVPREVPLLPARPEPARAARAPRLRGDLGRPRGRGQLRRQGSRLEADPARVREQRRLPAPHPVREAASERLRRLLRGDAAHPSTGSRRNRTYGTIHLNGLADLFVTDQRQYRSPQACDDVTLAPCAEERPEADDARRDPEGLVQARGHLLRGEVEAVGFEVMIMSLDSRSGSTRTRTSGTGTPRSARRSSALPPQARQEPRRTHRRHPHLRGRGNSRQRQHHRQGGGNRAGGGSVTSFGLPEETGIPATALDGLRKAADKHILFADFTAAATASCR